VWRQRQPRRAARTGSSLKATRPGSGRIVAALVLALALPFALSCSPNAERSSATPQQIAEEIIPQAGDATSYGIPLSLSNTQRFIDYYYASTLTAEQEAVKVKALRALKAPCCDDNTMDSC
jgi:hypothetical protein